MLSGAIRLGIAVALCLAVAAPAMAQRDYRALSGRVDQIFRDVDRRDAPGAAVVVVWNGEVVHRGGYGTANLEEGTPVTPSTVFDIASLSKQFAGMAIAMLVEQGAISPDDDIRDYIPEVPDLGDTITVGHLLHHTSGLRDWPPTLTVAGWQMDDAIALEDVLGMVRNQRELNFAPGSEYSYSNTGYNLLALLVARVTGQSFPEWTAEHIFRPLDMRDTHFRDDHREVAANWAVGYRHEEDSYNRIPNALAAYGSSSLLTTVDDLAKWLVNFDDPQVGSPAVVQRMRTPGVLNSGREISYAYGLNIRAYRGRLTASHGGAWAGFRAFLLHFPEQNFGVAVLSNDARMAAGRRSYQIADIYLANQFRLRRVAPGNWALLPKIAVDEAVLSEYAGTYLVGRSRLVTIVREGDSLVVKEAAEPKYPMRAMSETEFYVPAHGARVLFQRDDSGVVTHLRYRGQLAPRVEPYVPSPGELVGYEGEYYSDELDTTYEVVLQADELVARHSRHGDVALLPLLPDEFRGEERFMREVRFVRDGTDRVTGLLISSGGARNLRFERRMP
jgi:CubicO group peptidase (beta-lactamase class C family)